MLEARFWPRQYLPPRQNFPQPCGVRSPALPGRRPHVTRGLPQRPRSSSGKSECPNHSRHAPSSSRRRSWRRISPGWARRFVPSMPPAPMLSSPAPRCSRATPRKPTNPIFRRSETQPRWRAARPSKSSLGQSAVRASETLRPRLSYSSRVSRPPLITLALCSFPFGW